MGESEEQTQDTGSAMVPMTALAERSAGALADSDHDGIVNELLTALMFNHELKLHELRKKLLEKNQSATFLPTLSSTAREAVYARKVLSHKVVNEPLGLLNFLVDQDVLDSLPTQHPDWFGVPHEHKQFQGEVFTLTHAALGIHRVIWAEFSGPNDEGKAKADERVPPYHPKKRMVASLELTYLFIQHQLSQGCSMRMVHHKATSLFCVAPRRVVYFLARNIRPSWGPGTSTTVPPLGSKEECARSLMLQIMRDQGLDRELIGKLLSDMEKKNLKVIHVLPTPVGSTLQAPQSTQLETANVTEEETTQPTDEEPTLVRETSQPHLQGREWRDLFIKSETAKALLHAELHNPHTGRVLRGTRLLANILGIDELSNPAWPTSIIKTSMEIGLEGGTALEVSQSILLKEMDRSTYYPTLEERLVKLAQSPRVVGSNKEWMVADEIDEEAMAEIQEKILKPMHLNAIMVATRGNLSLVRTFALLIFINEGKMPPFCWRLMACMAYTALLMIGDMNASETVKLERGASRHLQSKAEELCRGFKTVTAIPSEIVDDQIYGKLRNAGPSSLTSILNHALQDLVLEFFGRSSKEKQKDMFQLHNEFPYEALHVLPAMTGRPFLVIKTIGPIINMEGEITFSQCLGRNTTPDDQPLFDVFHVDNEGRRHVCTYGDLEEAQSGLGQRTPYIGLKVCVEGTHYFLPVVSSELGGKLQALG